MGKKVIFLLLFAFLGISPGLRAADPNPAFQRYFDRELVTLKASAQQQLKRLEDELRQESQIHTQAQSQLTKLETQNRTLDQSKSFFNRNESKMKNNQTVMARLSQEIQAAKGRLDKKNQIVQRQKRLLAGITQELDLRRFQEEHRLNKNLETYETPALYETLTAYRQIHAREKAQLAYYQQELAKRGDQFDDTSVRLQKMVDQLRKQAEATAFSFHTIHGELTRRKEDLSFEKEQIEEKSERQEQLTETQNRQLEKKNTGKSTSFLLRSFDSQKEEEIEKRKVNEEQKLLIYFVISVLLFLVIILWVKKTFSNRTSYGRYRSANRPRAKLRMKR